MKNLRFLFLTISSIFLFFCLLFAQASESHAARKNSQGEEPENNSKILRTVGTSCLKVANLSIAAAAPHLGEMMAPGYINITKKGWLSNIELTEAKSWGLAAGAATGNTLKVLLEDVESYFLNENSTMSCRKIGRSLVKAAASGCMAYVACQLGEGLGYYGTSQLVYLFSDGSFFNFTVGGSVLGSLLSCVPNNLWQGSVLVPLMPVISKASGIGTAILGASLTSSVIDRFMIEPLSPTKQKQTIAQSIKRQNIKKRK